MDSARSGSRRRRSVDRRPLCSDDSSSFSDSDCDRRSGCENIDHWRRYNWRAVENIYRKLCCKLPCLTYKDISCLGFYLFFSILFGVFLYLYGLTLIHQVFRLLRILAQVILPATWLKSTEEIVNEALAKYSADRLALTDYALESAGGTVLCSSETYYAKSGFISVFNWPAFYHSSSPNFVIQPEVHPGKCWAMNGNQGFVTIQLVMPIVVTTVSLEHIPVEISVAGKVNSAPRDFMIVGKERGMDSQDILLGSFTYKLRENPIQIFEIKDPYCLAKDAPENCGPNKVIISIITLKIINNYGSSEYTCIYRFRVHGNPTPTA